MYVYCLCHWFNVQKLEILFSVCVWNLVFLREEGQIEPLHTPTMVCNLSKIMTFFLTTALKVRYIMSQWTQKETIFKKNIDKIDAKMQKS